MNSKLIFGKESIVWNNPFTLHNESQVLCKPNRLELGLLFFSLSTKISFAKCSKTRPSLCSSKENFGLVHTRESARKSDRPHRAHFALFRGGSTHRAQFFIKWPMLLNTHITLEWLLCGIKGCYLSPKKQCSSTWKRTCSASHTHSQWT
jgi:hypothetical protein